MKAITVALLFILLCSSVSAVTRYKKFNTIEAAIDFVAYLKPITDEEIGRTTWWSAHKIVAIPTSIDKEGNIKCKFIVYWTEQSKDEELQHGANHSVLSDAEYIDRAVKEERRKKK